MMSNFLMSSDFIFRKYSRSSLKIFSRKTVWCWAVGPTPTPWRLIGRTITCKKSDNFALIDKLVIYSLCRQLSIRNNDYKKTILTSISKIGANPTESDELGFKGALVPYKF